jgi:hypothetical protein
MKPEKNDNPAGFWPKSLQNCLKMEKKQSKRQNRLIWG